MIAQLDILKDATDEFGLFAALGERRATLSTVCATELPEAWREAVCDVDDEGEPTTRAIMAGMVLLIAVAWVFELQSIVINDDLVRTVVIASIFALSLEELKSAGIIGNYTDESLGSLLTEFIARNGHA